MIRIVTAREQAEAVLPWVRLAVDGPGGDMFGEDFGQLPDATQGMQTGGQGQTGGAVDLNNDGMVSAQEAAHSAEEAKWSSEEARYNMEAEKLKLQPKPPPPPAPMPAPAPQQQPQQQGMQPQQPQLQTASADPDLRPPKGAPSLWLASQMAGLPEADAVWAGTTESDEPGYGSPAPGGTSPSGGTII